MKKSLLKITVFLAIYFAIPFNIVAQNGSLDLSFDGDGKVTTDVGVNKNDSANALAIQSDGKIVVAGTTSSGSNTAFAVLRYNTNGSLDNTFGINGKVITDFGTFNDFANSVVIQNDGKILVAGGAKNSVNFDFAIVRYNDDGSLDNTFDNDGIVLTDFLSFDDFATSIIISNNKIIAVGSCNNGNNTDFAISRYNIDGSLDLTFDNDGKNITQVGMSTDVAQSVAVQSNNKIIAAGYSRANSNNTFATVRYNDNGSLDSTFNGIGIAQTDFFGTNSDLAKSIAIQSDDKIVVAGNGTSNNTSVFEMVRYNEDGNVDITFGNNGIVTSNIGNSYEIGTSMKIQIDGKIIMTGHTLINSTNPNNPSFVTKRFNANGSLDSTFGNSGNVFTAIGTENVNANSLAIQNDGKIIIAGSSRNLTQNSLIDFAIIRLNNNILSLNEFSNKNKDIKIYPNPFSNKNNLQTNFILDKGTAIIYNVLGEKIYQIDDINGNTINSNYYFEQAGVYFITVIQNGNIITKQKLVVIN